ncbi:hypothetical protein RHSIM_Rhsim05G0210800 [Rhododendron simsii]|uniref:Uncharacterized protein n=1 Tax=Rhododendron simsii TaxID=118357 RepID=A0A834LMP4_RHOSS|nr:hypothetical protein RHSIM_Rhsim05G0210800 [Rhododendron simsii]
MEERAIINGGDPQSCNARSGMVLDCTVSVLRLGLSCSDSLPSERIPMNIRDPIPSTSPPPTNHQSLPKILPIQTPTVHRTSLHRQSFGRQNELPINFWSTMNFEGDFPALSRDSDYLGILGGTSSNCNLIGEQVSVPKDVAPNLQYLQKENSMLRKVLAEKSGSALPLTVDNGCSKDGMGGPES